MIKKNSWAEDTTVEAIAGIALGAEAEVGAELMGNFSAVGAALGMVEVGVSVVGVSVLGVAELGVSVLGVIVCV
jgi:hypothetical protein